MTDLVTWLRERLDEDERVALATHAEVLNWIAGDVSDNGEPHCGAYIRHWGRDRALNEVAAKRRLLTLHPHRRFWEPLRAESEFLEDRRPAFDEDPRFVGCEDCDWNPRMEEFEPGWWCDTVRLLALPYADRPGYLEEWRPA